MSKVEKTVEGSIDDLQCLKNSPVFLLIFRIRYFYFGGARSKGFAQLRDVLKLYPEVPKLLQN